ncbi:sigma-70 family RNA polymerase sigma factor [candidate division KSB1 bacterium]|nr:sigma-70 family RNA polymerase sigma factor [candidate division KSB1 bacterium]
MTSDISDSLLIGQAIDGNQQAFAQLLSRYRGSIYNLIYKMVHNREETEDLVQEAFIKAFASLATFNDEYAFSTWLYKIAINNCIDHFRKRRLKTFSMDTPIESKDGSIQREFSDSSYLPDKPLLSKEKNRLIETAIEELPEKYRISIVLRHNEEKSYEEISQILNIPLGTVKARIFRAREMLKKKLKDNLMP